MRKSRIGIGRHVRIDTRWATVNAETIRSQAAGLLMSQATKDPEEDMKKRAKRAKDQVIEASNGQAEG
jgi:hypothetical protein